jgi:DNA polymerase III alpha subunit
MSMVQLRIRTEYSFGETFAPIPRVIERLKALGCTAAGIVDGSTWGHVKWHKACVAAGIAPLLGVEVVVSDEAETPRMWFLAKNTEGLKEMYRFTSKSHHQKVATQRGSLPRLYRSDVLAMSPNIIKFAGDVTDGEFLKKAKAYVDLNPASRILNMKKENIAKAMKLKLVSTSDNAFAFEEDKEIFELIANGMKPTPQYILPKLEHAEVAKKIARECEGLALPKAPMIVAKGDLEKLCRDGIKERKLKWTPEYEARLQHELKLIKAKNFESYFIVVADMVRYAKQHMLVGPSRGSAAGSIVCYLSRITEVDPIPPKLFFERFIDISRSDLPDIDLDFPDDKRHLVFSYMVEKYGADNVAKIGTVALFKPKSALIEVCKSLGIPPTATASVKIAMIERASHDERASHCLGDTFTGTEPGRQFIAAYPQAMKAAMVEGHASHTGVHAAGLLVCNVPIIDFATVDANGIAHIEKGAAESLGLLKIDVLGLRTLGILEDSGVKIDWYNLTFDDPKTFSSVFNRGRFCGIFQFEGAALRDISRRVKFKTLREIDAVTALARPGPFAGGVTEEYLNRADGKKYDSIHPSVTKHMEDTYGLPVYQEQTIAILREIGQFSWDDTGEARKAISKRYGKEYFDKLWVKFVAGATKQGFSESEAQKIWDMISVMGAWQMNKAHTHSYAVISYWTAYLKAHHPLEFAAANLRSAKDEESAIQLLREMHKEGVKYIPFDLKLSQENWAVQKGKLVGGFLSLKGFGEVKAKKYRELRDAGKLSPKQIEELKNAPNVFADIFPMKTRYGEYFTNPGKFGLADKPILIGDLDGTQEGSYLILGELERKNARNANEETEIQKRRAKGKIGQAAIETEDLEYLDLRIKDDTGMVGTRIGRWDYQRMGVEILEKVPEGAVLLVRARFKKGIRFGFIQKLKRIDEKETA